jgi:hypothetical protein
VEPISVMGLLVNRFGDRWGRLITAEEGNRLDGVASTLAQDLVAQAKSASCAVICDTEVLHTLPDLNPTALLYPHSGERVIVVTVKASRVVGGWWLQERVILYAWLSGW